MKEKIWLVVVFFLFVVVFFAAYEGNKTYALDDVTRAYSYTPRDTIKAYKLDTNETRLYTAYNKLNDSLDRKFARFTSFKDSTFDTIKARFGRIDSITSSRHVSTDSIIRLNCISGNPVFDSIQGTDKISGNPIIDSIKGMDNIAGNPKIDSLKEVDRISGNPLIDSIQGVDNIAGNPKIDSLKEVDKISGNPIIDSIQGVDKISGNPIIDSIQGMDKITGNPVIDSISGNIRITGSIAKFDSINLDAGSIGINNAGTNFQLHNYDLRNGALQGKITCSSYTDTLQLRRTGSFLDIDSVACRRIIADSSFYVIGATNFPIIRMKITDATNDTLEITAGAKTWQFVPVGDK